MSGVCYNIRAFVSKDSWQQETVEVQPRKGIAK